MKRIIKLKRKRKFINIKVIIVLVAAVILTTIGIKAGDNLINNYKSDGGNSFCPEEMVFITSASGGFCLDKYEASAGPGCLYADPANQRDSRINISDAGCRPVSVSGRIPWRFISQDQAAVACAQAGKRLPTNSEWQQGALGTPDKANGWTNTDCQVSSNWSMQPGLTGSGRNCVSAAGVFDMIGNVWEWTEGTVTDGNFNGQILPPAGYIDSTDGAGMPGATNGSAPDINYNQDYFWIKANGLRGIARGGYWQNESNAGLYAAYVVVPPSAVEAGIGFRCAR